MTSSEIAFEELGPSKSVFKEKLHIIEWDHLNLWKFYPMALGTSWSVRCMLYPMSVVKSRLQLQKQSNVYKGMRHAFVDIIRTEGISALYKGFWVTLPQLSASFVYSTIYEKFRNVLHVNASITSPPVVSAAAGGVASTFTQIIFVPTDIVAQHMMVYNNPQRFSGGSSPQNVAVIETLRKDGLERKLTLGLRVIRAVYKCDGLFGFYRGFLSSLMMYIPSSMIFWGSYYNVLGFLKKTKKKYIERRRAKGDQIPKDPEHENLLLLQAISGAMGGILSALLTNPLEVLRVRIQVHRTSYWDTIRRMYRFEGGRVFTKGLPPRMINNGIYSCLIMIGYETVKRACVLPEYQGSIVW